MTLMTRPKWERKKIYIIVKTYPTPSTKHQETVCTAGITEEGDWIRLYPVTYRHLPFDQQFKKYSWIEAEVKKNTQDIRKESFTPNLDTIELIEEPRKSKTDWENRKKILFPLVKNSLEELNSLYENEKISLGIFKPKEILDFYWRPESPKWSPDQENILSQLSLFGPQLRKLEKIPYSFHYKFVCNDPSCNGHDLIITDWEIYQAYRSWRWQHPNDVLDRIKQKWLNEIFSPNRDTYFVVGTTYPFPSFIILGVFWPPK